MTAWVFTLPVTILISGVLFYVAEQSQTMSALRGRPGGAMSDHARLNIYVMNYLGSVIWR